MLKLTNCLIDECDDYFVAGNALARKVVPVVVVQRVGLWRDPEAPPVHTESDTHTYTHTHTHTHTHT
eukprot:COSAG03_NODE_16349_length_404_cov_1.652459_2_plen_66_part_01